MTKNITIGTKVFVLRLNAVVPGYVTAIYNNRPDEILAIVCYKDSDTVNDYKDEYFNIDDIYLSFEDAKNNIKLLDESIPGDMDMRFTSKYKLGDVLNLRKDVIYRNYTIIGIYVNANGIEKPSIRYRVKSESGETSYIMEEKIDSYR